MVQKRLDSIQTAKFNTRNKILVKLICYYKNKLYLYKMKRNNIIISIERNKEPIARGNFKKLCNELKLPYHSLKMLKFPITHKDYVIFKVEFI